MAEGDEFEPTIQDLQDEIARLRSAWGDLRIRLIAAKLHLRTPDASLGRIAKSQGINMALDYMRSYDV